MSNPVYVPAHLELKLELHNNQEVHAPTELRTYFIRNGLNRAPQESVWVVATNGTENIRAVVEVARGGFHEVDVWFPALYAAVLTSGSDRFIMVHNHPTDDPSPTMPDVDLTKKIMDGANMLGLFFDDHIIITPSGQTFSFANTGLLKPSAKLAKMAKTNRAAVLSEV